MDYGPALACSLKLGDKQWVTKGLVLRLGDGDAAVCFDTELLRPAAAWVNVPTLLGMRRTGWAKVLELQGLHFSAALRPDGPVLRGDVVFGAARGPGWARDGKFDDPRPAPYGPPPRQWGRWKGIYLSGPDVVMAYAIGDVDVLELTGVERAGKVTAIARTIHLGAGPEMLLAVAEVKGASGSSDGDRSTLDAGPRPGTATVVGIVGMKGPQWQVADGRIVLKLPKRDAATTFKLLTSTLAKGEEAKVDDLLAGSPPPANLPALCKGGPPRWQSATVTRGRLGGAGGAYALDTIELPRNNPWAAVLRPTGIDFLPDGRAAVCTLGGDVWIASGLDASLRGVTWKRFASGLYEPLGLKVVDGMIYVMGRDQITRLHDLNSDGEADFLENFNNDAVVTELVHDFPMDLQTDAEGNFYYGRCGTGLEPYDRVFEHHGAILKVSKDGERTDVVARGLRVPNGVCLSPDGMLTCADNEGSWSPASRINLVRPGKFYGDMRVALGEPKSGDFERPIVWFPRSFETSPAGQVWAPKNWGPLGGQMLTLSYGTSSLNWVMLDRVGDVVQGAAVKWPLKFDSGMIRARFGPDGHLYACGLRGWQTNAGKEGALQRLRWTGGAAVVPVGYRVTKAGFVITFSGKPDAAAAADAKNWSVERWEYKWTSKYGSPEYSVERPGVQGRDEVAVASVELLPDGKSVLVKPAKHGPVMQVRIKYVMGEVKGEIVGTVNALGE